MDNTTTQGKDDTIQLLSPRSGKPAITVLGLNTLRSAPGNVPNGTGVPAGNIRFNADASTEDLVETFRYADQLNRSWPAIRAGVARELEHRGVNVGDWRSGTTLDTGGINAGREGYESRR